MWNSENIPNQWQKGLIVKIPKKGDLETCDNWRVINTKQNLHQDLTEQNWNLDNDDNDYSSTDSVASDIDEDIRMLRKGKDSSADSSLLEVAVEDEVQLDWRLSLVEVYKTGLRIRLKNQCPLVANKWLWLFFLNKDMF